MTSSPESTRSDSSESDNVLIGRSIDEPALFNEVFQRHVNAVFRFVAARVGPRCAEDIVAECFLTAFIIRHRFDHDVRSARPWLYGIAANKIHEHHDDERKWLSRCAAARAVDDADNRLNDESTDSHARIDARRLRPEIAAAMLALSTAERDVLLLYALEGFSYREIALTLGMREGTVKSHMSRARHRMQATFSPSLGILGRK